MALPEKIVQTIPEFSINKKRNLIEEITLLNYFLHQTSTLHNDFPGFNHGIRMIHAIEIL